jgi:hypothetical protein
MMAIQVHLAWFSRDDGGWIGEWRGRLPRPDLPAGLIGEARLLALNAWLHDQQRYIAPQASAHETIDQCWDRDRWDGCPSGGAVCLDVTRFAWPVGDHVWHRWDDRELALDWPESSGQRFIQVDDDLRVGAHLHSHRPARSVPGRRMLRVAGSQLEPFWGDLWGRFERRGAGWIFVPSDGLEASGRPLVSPAARSALAAADMFDLALLEQRDKELVTWR